MTKFVFVVLMTVLASLHGLMVADALRTQERALEDLRRQLGEERAEHDDCEEALDAIWLDADNGVVAASYYEQLLECLTGSRM